MAGSTSHPNSEEPPLPPKAKSIVQDQLRRARWMTTTSYKLLLAESETPRTQAFDELVTDGSMSAQERVFLDNPDGEQYWPRAKHLVTENIWKSHFAIAYQRNMPADRRSVRLPLT